MVSLKKWFVLFCFASTLASAQPLVRPFQAQYQVGNGWVVAGTLTLRLQRQEQHWLLEGITTPQGLFALAGSAAHIHDRIILKQPGDSPALDNWQALRFEHQEGGRVTKTWDGVGPPDNLGILLSLAHQLQQQKHQGELLYRDPENRSHTFTWTWQGKEQISLEALGNTATEYVRRSNSGQDEEQHSWHAQAFDYLPVKIENRESGKTTLQILLKQWRWL